MFARLNPFARGPGGPPAGGPPGASPRPGGVTVSRGIDYRAWIVVIVIVALFAFVYSGQALVTLNVLKGQLLQLVPTLADVLALVGLASFLLSLKMRHAPTGHWLDRMAKKWHWVGPAAIVAGVVAIPLTVHIITTGQQEAAALNKSSVAQQAGALPNCPAGPIVAPSKVP